MYRNLSDLLARVQETVPYLGVKLQDINQPGMFGDTPLIQVMTWDDLAAATLLLKAGADIAATGENGDTALHRAVGSGNVELVKLLLTNEAPRLVQNNDGYTPLGMAQLLRSEAIAELLEGEAD
jgi:ankyrin repeat protein